MIPLFKVESEFTAFGCFALITRIVRSVFFDGSYAVGATGFSLVTFTCKDNLPVACFQSESEFTRFIFINLEFPRHFDSPLVVAKLGITTLSLDYLNLRSSLMILNYISQKS